MSVPGTPCSPEAGRRSAHRIGQVLWLKGRTIQGSFTCWPRKGHSLDSMEDRPQRGNRQVCRVQWSPLKTTQNVSGSASHMGDAVKDDHKM